MAFSQPEKTTQSTSDPEPGRPRAPHYDSAYTCHTVSPPSTRSPHRDRSQLQLWKQKVVERIPAPLRRRAQKIVLWIQGPQPPRTHEIKPFFESIQTIPIRLLAKVPPTGRWTLLFAAFVLWVVLFGVLIADFSLPDDVGGFGAPVRLQCTNRLWTNAKVCGLDGEQCLPFVDSSFVFSCPAGCAPTMVLNPYAVGSQQIAYQALVVGGTPEDQPVYRGDSFICSAAIQAGVISDERGGCGVVSLVGERDHYGSTDRNGISSVEFNSTFPLSFQFNDAEAVIGAAAKCQDPRWDLLILSTIFTSFFSLFTNTPLSFFVPIFTITYFQISMASDPPFFSDYASLASTAVGNFLPAALIGALIYQFSIRKTLKNLNAQLEKTILWVGGLWVGALSNLTFEKIPIQRLTPHDIRQQPGGVVALIVIVLVLVAVVLYQAWCFRIEGRLPRYLGLYCLLGVGLLILLSIPEENLRIHHYILALLLLPGTALQTRPSLLYQGLLIGLFINGIARWGFASILETSAALRGDALRGTVSPAMQFLPSVSVSPDNANITFDWHVLPTGWEGVSVLVNDVERYRGLGRNGDSRFTWERNDVDLPFYFRLGLVNYLPFGQLAYTDFTRAGVWWGNGTWSGIPRGLS